jgi:hypothetical protein
LIGEAERSIEAFAAFVTEHLPGMQDAAERAGS